MADPILFLTYLDGKRQGQTMRFDRPAVTIGRDPAADVPFPGFDEISGRHATVHRTAKGFVVEDSSLNGTYHNGARISGKAGVAHGDVLQIGTDGPKLRVGIDQPGPGHVQMAGPAGAARPFGQAAKPPTGAHAVGPGSPQGRSGPPTQPQHNRTAPTGSPSMPARPAAAGRMSAVQSSAGEPGGTHPAAGAGGTHPAAGAGGTHPAAGAAPDGGLAVPDTFGGATMAVDNADAVLAAVEAMQRSVPLAAAAAAKASPAAAPQLVAGGAAVEAISDTLRQRGDGPGGAPMGTRMMTTFFAAVTDEGRPRLVVERVDGGSFGDGRSGPKSLELVGEVFRIGKDPRAEIPFDHEPEAVASQVDQHHAKIIYYGGEFVLVDNDSPNKTYVDGKPVNRLPLKGGEVITLGQKGPKLRVQPLPPKGLHPSKPQPAVASPGLLQAARSEVQIGGGKTFAMSSAAALLAQQMAEQRARARLLKEISVKSQKTIVIGRAGGLDLTLDSVQVSKRHAKIEWRKGQKGPVPYVVDLGSANGTFVGGQSIKEHPLKPKDEVAIGPFMLQIEGESLKIFDFRQAGVSCLNLERRDPRTGRVFLDKVSIVVRPSEFVCLLGPSGSGKSTLLKTLSGAERASGGSVLVNDTDFYAEYARLKSQVGYVPQEDIVHPELSVRRTLEYAARLRLPAELDASAVKRRIEEVLSILELTEHQHKPVHKLSGGQKKRVSIGVELLTEPGLLYLDEPTSGLDPNLEGKMMVLFRELALRGNTVVCVTHHLDNVHLADKVGIMYSGKLVFFGTPDEALEHFKVRKLPEIFERLAERQDAEAFRDEYLSSGPYAAHLAAEVLLLEETLSEKAKGKGKEAPPPKAKDAGAGFFKQFFLLSARYFEILTRDWKNTLILVLQAPIVAGVICVSIPTTKLTRTPTSTMLLVLCLSALWFGCSNAAREITKESSIFARERMVSLKVVPYVGSKFIVLQLFSLLQCLLMQLIVFRFANTPAMRYVATDPQLWALSLANIYVLSLAGVGLGLFISAYAGNSDKAMSLVPIVLIPQILLSGGFGLFSASSKIRPVSYAISLNWALDSAKRIALCPLGEKSRCFACLTGTDPDLEEADPLELPKPLRILKEELPTRCIADQQRTRSEVTEIVMNGLYGPYKLAPPGKPKTRIWPERGIGVVGGMVVLYFIGVCVALARKRR